MWLGVAGGMGTVARYGLSNAVQRVCGSGFWGGFGGGFPFGTLAVNVAGCFFFGLAWSLFAHGLQSGQVRLIVFVGFLGAFTTFSTYAFEATQFMRDDRWALAAAHLLAHNTLGLISVVLGLWLGRGLYSM